MTKDTTKTLLRSGAAAIALFLATTAAAQQRQFDLPAQEAVMAIPELARQAGIQISAPAAALKGIQTKELRGIRDARVALQTLIAGTGLEEYPVEAVIVSDAFSTSPLGYLKRFHTTWPSQKPLDDVHCGARPWGEDVQNGSSGTPISIWIS